MTLERNDVARDGEFHRRIFGFDECLEQLRDGVFASRGDALFADHALALSLAQHRNRFGDARRVASERESARFDAVLNLAAQFGNADHRAAARNGFGESIAESALIHRSGKIRIRR